MVATSSTLHEPVEKDSDEDSSRYSLHEPFRPTVYKWNQRPVFRRLLTPPIVRCALPNVVALLVLATFDWLTLCNHFVWLV